MIEFSQATKTASKKMPGFVLSQCTDIGDRWAFAFELPNGKPVPPGTPFICINKHTGEAEEITVPPIDNLFLLEAGKDVPLQ